MCYFLLIEFFTCIISLCEVVFSCLYKILTDVCVYVSGCSSIPSSPSSFVKQPYLDSLADKDTFNHQNVNSQRNNVCLTENKLHGSLQQHRNCLHSCSVEKAHRSCSDREKSDNMLVDSLGTESNKQLNTCDIDPQTSDNCKNIINWNTNCTFARPRIFCLQHALEIEELLEGKGGVHALIICHSGTVQR
jgi:hypothetical protein